MPKYGFQGIKGKGSTAQVVVSAPSFAAAKKKAKLKPGRYTCWSDVQDHGHGNYTGKKLKTQVAVLKSGQVKSKTRRRRRRRKKA